MVQETTSEEASQPQRRRALKWLLGAIAVITVTNLIGDGLAAGLVEEHPLWLIALNSRKRWILAVVPHTDVVPFFLVAVARQLLSDPIYYALGRWYGDAGARWIEKQMGEGGMVIRWLESSFAKAAWPMVALFPNHIICMLAGASGMPPLLFYALNLGGTIALMVLFRTVGDVFGGPIEAVTGFLNEYRIPLIILSFALIGVNLAMRKREGRTQFDEVAELERELTKEIELDGMDELEPVDEPDVDQVRKGPETS